MDFECLSNQIVKVYSSRNHIATKHSSRPIPNAQSRTKFIVHLLREKSDLTLVILAMPEEPVSLDSLSHHTANLVDLPNWVF